MQALKIKRCGDSMRWYKDLIGQTVPYLGTMRNPSEYKSREPSGLINFVQIADAEIVEINHEEL